MALRARRAAGRLTVQTTSSSNAVNMPLLADTIREAHADAFRARRFWARAETILDKTRWPDHTGGLVTLPEDAPQPFDSAGAGVPLARSLTRWPDGVPIAGEIRRVSGGRALGETAPLPPSVVEKARSSSAPRRQDARTGIEDGDLWSSSSARPAERPRELVIGKVGELLYVGRCGRSTARRRS